MPRGVVHLKSITQRGWGTRKEKTGMRWWLVVSISLTCVRTCGRSCLPPTRRCNRSFVFPPSSCLREVGHDTRRPVSGSSRQSRAPAPKRTKGLRTRLSTWAGRGGRRQSARQLAVRCNRTRTRGMQSRRTARSPDRTSWGAREGLQHRLQSARSRAQAPWPPTSPHRIPRVWVCQNGGAETPPRCWYTGQWARW